MLAAVVNRNIGRAGLGRVSPSSRCTLGEAAGGAGRATAQVHGVLPRSAIRERLGQGAARGKAARNMEPQMHTDAHGWGRTNATALLTRRGRLGSALNAHAGLRPIRVHRCASVVPLSCLPCLPLLRCPACRSDASGELLCCPPRRPVLVHGLFAVMRQADRRWTNRRRAPVPCAAAASRHRRAVPNWCMGFWPHSAWRSPAAWRHRRDRTAGHGVSPPKNAGAGRTRRLDLRHAVQLAPAVGVATGQPCRPVRRATAQASKSLTQMHSRWTPMHADRTWANAPVLLIRIGRV
jgi:hypothetical protein